MTKAHDMVKTTQEEESLKTRSNISVALEIEQKNK
jgi:hypothetical protein